MKKLIILLIISGCSMPITIIERSSIDKLEPIYIEFKTENEAKRVQKRITKNCGTPLRNGNILELYPEHIECSRKILGKEYGYIRNKYKNYLNEPSL